MTSIDPCFRQLSTASGSPLWHYYRPGANGITLRVMVLAGTRDERWPAQAGLAHAVEHMMFQGTEKFASNQDIDAYVEEVGGTFGGATSTEVSYFDVTVPVTHTRRGIEVLGQLISAPTFPEDKLNCEKQVILHEIKDRDDSPRAHVVKNYNEMVYGDHPLGRDILGIQASVTAFQQEDFVAFKNQFYTSSNIVFLAVGGMGAEETTQLFDEFFPPLRGRKILRQPQAPSATSPKERILERDVEQAYIMLGASAGPAASEDVFLLELFANMIDGGSSFPLFQDVRNKRGLCYDIGSSLKSGTDASDLSIHMVTNPRRYQNAIDAVLAVIQNTKDSEKVLERAKNAWIGSLSLAWDDLGNVIEDSTTDILDFGMPQSLEQTRSKIEHATIDDIRGVVEKYLVNDHLVRAILLPKTK